MSDKFNNERQYLSKDEFVEKFGHIKVKLKGCAKSLFFFEVEEEYYHLYISVDTKNILPTIIFTTNREYSVKQFELFSGNYLDYNVNYSIIQEHEDKPLPWEVN